MLLLRRLPLSTFFHWSIDLHVGVDQTPNLECPSCEIWESNPKSYWLKRWNSNTIHVVFQSKPKIIQDESDGLWLEFMLTCAKLQTPAHTSTCYECRKDTKRLLGVAKELLQNNEALTLELSQTLHPREAGLVHALCTLTSSRCCIWIDGNHLINLKSRSEPSMVEVGPFLLSYNIFSWFKKKKKKR